MCSVIPFANLTSVAEDALRILSQRQYERQRVQDRFNHLHVESKALSSAIRHIDSRSVKDAG